MSRAAIASSFQKRTIEDQVRNASPTKIHLQHISLKDAWDQLSEEHRESLSSVLTITRYQGQKSIYTKNLTWKRCFHPVRLPRTAFTRRFKKKTRAICGQHTLRSNLLPVKSGEERLQSCMLRIQEYILVRQHHAQVTLILSLVLRPMTLYMSVTML
jgi:hypothetical protein